MDKGISIPESPPLNFTVAAAEKVGQLIEQEGNSALKLRVYISGGGCSGFQYGFTFDEAILDGDTEIEKLGVKLLVDPMSVQYLLGAESITKRIFRVRSSLFVTPMLRQLVVAGPHSRSEC